MSETKGAKPTVMVSSTVLDLPDHRGQVRDACLREGMFPLMMEHLPATPADAITESIHMVDEADIYVGVFAYRYGYVPEGHEKSITEMEVDRAIERKIPRYLFFIADDHPVTGRDVETGPGAERLKQLKDRLEKSDNIVPRFHSPDDLRGLVIQALAARRSSGPTTLHYISDIPAAPAPYVAHPYTLLQTEGVVGRQAELNLLTDWVAKPDAEVHKANVFSVVAMGGMGKSALTWRWFNDIAPNEMRPLAGRMWWSFYESDARFENFVSRALVYATGNSDLQSLPNAEQQDRLLQVLDREPYLLVLDGLERVLNAYARPDFAHLGEADVEDRLLGTQPGQGVQHRLRRAADPRVGVFLQRLAAVKASRILISTRLFPADLETVTGRPIPGAWSYELGGLTDDDAINLWRALGVSGSRDELTRLFQSVENYPLLIRALAGEVASYRPAPGDFDRWLNAHPQFDPTAVPLVQRKSHVLEFSLRDLGETATKVLQTIAAFRMPASYETLVALLVGEGKLFANEPALDVDLRELEDRGLLGWDRRANRYDEHPIVRGVAWRSVDAGGKRSIYESLATYFDPMAKVDDTKVRSLEELTPGMELLNALIQLDRISDAATILTERLAEGCAELSNWRQLADLGASLAERPEAVEGLGKDNREEVWMCCAMAEYVSGYPAKAAIYWRRLQACAEVAISKVRFAAMTALSEALAGAPGQGEACVRQAMAENGRPSALDRPYRPDPIGLLALGMILAIRGESGGVRTLLEGGRLLEPEFGEDVEDRRVQALLLGVDISLARVGVWTGDLALAETRCESALRLATDTHDDKLRAEAMAVLGSIAVRRVELEKADEYLHPALQVARRCGLLREEIEALLGLAMLHHARKEDSVARQLLGEVLDLASSTGNRLMSADAQNLLAEIDRDAGLADSARDAARAAYLASWCDGPPFAYGFGLMMAQSHLTALGEAPIHGMGRYVDRWLATGSGSETWREASNRAIHDPDPKTRAAALDDILRECVLHPETPSLLRSIAKSDQADSVRASALAALQAGWPDDWSPPHSGSS